MQNVGGSSIQPNKNQIDNLKKKPGRICDYTHVILQMYSHK